MAPSSPVGFFALPRELRDTIYQELVSIHHRQNPDRDLGKIWHLPATLGGTMQDDFPLRMRQRLPGPSFEKLLRINDQFSTELCEELRATKLSVVLELDLLFKTSTRKLRQPVQHRQISSHQSPYTLDATMAPPLSAKTVQRHLKIWSFDRLHPAFARCLTTIRIRVPNMSRFQPELRWYQGADFRHFIIPLKIFLGTTGPALMAKLPGLRTLEVAFSDSWFPLTLAGNPSYVPAPMVRCLDLLWQPRTRYIGGQSWPIFFMSRSRLHDWIENVSDEATDLAWVVGCLNYGHGDYVRIHPGVDIDPPGIPNKTTNVPGHRSDPRRQIPRRVFIGTA